MARYLPVSRSALAGKGWRKYDSYAFAAKDVVAPLLLEEVTQAMATMPLGFRRASEDAPFELVALLSGQPNLNLFVGPDGKWLGNYKPACYRGYPFRLLPEESSDRQILCVDVDSGLIVDTPDPDEPEFFAADGSPGPLVQRILNFLETCEQSRQRTFQVVNELVPFKLLVPWEVKVVVPGQDEPITIDGLYRVDNVALNALPGPALEMLARRGALTLAYAQICSQARLSSLRRLAGLRDTLQKRSDAAKAPVSLDLDLDTLFGEHGENIKFDA